MSMPFLIKGEFFKEYSSAIVFCIYTDKVTAMAVKNENGRVVAVESVNEPQEGLLRPGADSVEKILLNCEKALQALSADARAGIKDFIVVLGAGVGQFSFAQIKWIRDDKEKKITAQERDDALAQWRGQKEEERDFLFRTIPQRFWADGFAVSDAVGLNGKEITVDTVTMACDKALVRGFSAYADSSAMRFRGMTDIRLAAAAWRRIFKENESALIAVLSENETDVLVVRSGACAGVGVFAGGYGILREEVGRVFAVGAEEARGLIVAFHTGALSAEPSARVKEIIDSVKTVLINGASAAAAKIDSSRLLPGNIWVAAPAESRWAEEALSTVAWLSGLPLERGAKVYSAAQESGQAEKSVFELMVSEYL